MKRLRILLLAVVAMGMALSVRATELRVFAAASLSDALTELAPTYKALTGDTLVFNLGGSGLLARQIKEGAPADLFISADEIQADKLDKAGLLEPGTRRILVANVLVVIAPADSSDEAPASLAALSDRRVRRIAIGDPDVVPAGTYARSVLRKAGVWDVLQPKLVPLENVRAVLAAVDSGNADAGFVYRTDAAISKRAKVAFEVPENLAPKIVYPMAVVKGSSQVDRAKALLRFLSGPEAAAVLRRYGFTVPSQAN